jgi:hypothetical protein
MWKKRNTSRNWRKNRKRDYSEHLGVDGDIRITQEKYPTKCNLVIEFIISPFTEGSIIIIIIIKFY